jgi:hypothetical protein
MGRLMGWLMLVALVAGAGVARAQDPTGLTTKVIKAIDLQIQRFQTQTIWLQEAQKEVENVMSELRLGEIKGWVQQFKDLYDQYFQELWRVKAVLADYDKVAAIIQRQKDILAGYQRGMALFGNDSHFSADEIAHMGNVYAGMVSESLKNLDQLTKVIESFLTQMTDQQRMAIIDEAAQHMDGNYRDMQEFTQQNQLLSLQRARDANDYETLKKLYGL